MPTSSATYSPAAASGSSLACLELVHRQHRPAQGMESNKMRTRQGMQGRPPAWL